VTFDANDADPEEIDRTAANMARSLNDEVWDAATDERKDFWRVCVKDTIEALAYPRGPIRDRLLGRVHDRIKKTLT
jgi:hypothetical protein